jgi:hypothetical protein
MVYDRGLADRIADVLARLGERGARQKNVFGGRGFLMGSSTFVVVWDEDLIVKAPRAGAGGVDSARAARRSALMRQGPTGATG